MKQARIAGASFFLLMAAAQIQAAEPLLGTWKLKSQEVGGQKTDPEPLTLRITKSGNGFEFAFSVPVNNIQFVSMQYVSRLDGTESDVKDAQGVKIGTIKITRTGDSQYDVVLQGPNRPSATGKMVVSAGGKILTSESESHPPGRDKVHAVQTFTRL